MTLNQFIDFIETLKVGDRVKYKRYDDDTIFIGTVNSLPKRNDHWHERSSSTLSCPSVMLDKGITIDHPRFHSIGEDVLDAEENHMHHDWNYESTFEWIHIVDKVNIKLEDELFTI